MPIFRITGTGEERILRVTYHYTLTIQEESMECVGDYYEKIPQIDDVDIYRMFVGPHKATMVLLGSFSSMKDSRILLEKEIDKTSKEDYILAVEGNKDYIFRNE